LSEEEKKYGLFGLAAGYSPTNKPIKTHIKAKTLSGNGGSAQLTDCRSGAIGARDYKLVEDCVFCAAKQYREGKRPVMVLKLAARRETDKI
jgi:hypothetical protein